MKALSVVSFLAFFSLTACVTMNDFKKSQAQLNENAKKQKVYPNALAGGKATRDKCQNPTAEGKWELHITHGDAIVKQNKDTFGYFQTLCFKKKPEYTKLEIVGVHAGGGMGRAFFLLPRVSIFNEKWELVSQNLSRIKQDAFSGNLEAEVNLSSLPPGPYVMVVEADNRSGEQGIGEYAQATYAVVPIITSIDMYSLPTGKTRIYLKK
jgi:hypothetical protein